MIGLIQANALAEVVNGSPKIIQICPLEVCAQKAEANFVDKKIFLATKAIQTRMRQVNLQLAAGFFSLAAFCDLGRQFQIDLALSSGVAEPCRPIGAWCYRILKC